MDYALLATGIHHYLAYDVASLSDIMLCIAKQSKTGTHEYAVKTCITP